LLEQYELNEFEMNSPTVRKHNVWEKMPKKLKTKGTVLLEAMQQQIQITDWCI